MRLLSFALLWMLALSPARALAQRTPSEQAALIREAERLYEGGKYREAAELLEAAHAHTPDPRLLYNMARAYDQAGELRKALSAYQTYLSLRSGIDPQLLKRASLAVDRLETLIAKEEREMSERARLREEQAAARQRVETESAQRLAESQALMEREEYLAAQSRYLKRKTGALSLAVVSAAGVVGAVVWGLQARDARKSFDAAPTVEAKQTYQTRVEQKSLLADVSIGVSVLSLAAAFLVYPRGEAPPEGPRLAPAPAGSLGGGMEYIF